MELYYQQQIKADLCRLYSLNGYFGYNKLSEEDFYRYCDEYDALIEGLYSRNMDGFAEGRNITSYIIDKLENKFTLLIPINNYNNSREHIDIHYYKKLIHHTEFISFFEFNKTHIWVNKTIGGKWYKIDSLSGVNIIDPIIDNNNGKLLVIENKILYIEIDNYINQIQHKLSNSDNSDNSDNSYIPNSNYNQSNMNFKSILSSTPEILLYNLYHSLKLIKVETNNFNMAFESFDTFDEIYIEQLYILKNLKDILKNYIQSLRGNTNKSNSYFIQLRNLFKLIKL